MRRNRLTAEKARQRRQYYLEQEQTTWDRLLRLAGFAPYTEPMFRSAHPSTPRRLTKPEQAERRARYLLRRHLTTKQNDHLTRLNRFTVRGNWTGEQYLIYGRRRHMLGQNIYDQHGWMYGVGLDSPYSFWADWTKHPHPPSDVMLAQKLLIETDERLFLKTACKSRARHK